MLTAKRDNKLNQVDWFSRTKKSLRKLVEKKRYQEVVLAEHTMLDGEGRTVPAFNVDYAIHEYFKVKEHTLKTDPDKVDVL